MRFFLSGAGAFLIECLLIVVLIYATLPKKTQKYKLNNEDKLEFIQIQEIVEEKKQSVSQKPQASQKLKEAQQSPTSKPSPKVGSDVKKLFEKVDSSKPPVRQENIEDERAKFSSNVLKQEKYTYNAKQNNRMLEETRKINQTLDQIWDKEVQMSGPVPVDQTDGIYDEWFAEVKKKLDLAHSKWTNGVYAKVSSVVSISITQEGVFDYKITTYSRNRIYDEAIKQMLDSLKHEKFPPYPKGKVAMIEVTFKTSEGAGG